MVSFTRQESSSCSEKVEMRRRQHQQAVGFVWLNLICGYSCQPSQCCPAISVSSTSVGEEYQAAQLGVYTIKDNLTVNGRPVYKQVSGDQYFYYWVSIPTNINISTLNTKDRSVLMGFLSIIIGQPIKPIKTLSRTYLSLFLPCLSCGGHNQTANCLRSSVSFYRPKKACKTPKI